MSEEKGTPVSSKDVAPVVIGMLDLMSAFQKSGASFPKRAAALFLFLVCFAESEHLSKKELLELLQKNIERNWDTLHADYLRYVAHRKGLS